MASMSIDGRNIEFEGDNLTILDVARSAGIYIPTLCDHEELEPHGGCRMCLVDVEGINGYVPACSTTARDEMVVTTNTPDLNDLKRRIMQLLLIEHPSACLVCTDLESCKEYRNPANKAGQTTGCNTCPNYESCDLREVVEYLEIKELQFQSHYKELPVERLDPFFDRDYNLCILCGRCVRICNEVRGTSAICFANRGYEARVDTAYSVSHLDSGCVFCGACVDVCPTGALAPKSMKWIGEPDNSIETTCVLCSVGCQIQLETKWNRIMASKPGPKTDPPNYHHLCVLGRFCIPPMVNAPDRIKHPMIREEGKNVPVTWDEALDKAAELLDETSPRGVGFIAGPHMTTESAYAFQKLAREAARTSNLDFRDSDFPVALYGSLSNQDAVGRIQPLGELQNVDWMLAVGGDFVMTHQIVAKNVYSGIRKGVPLFVIGKAGRILGRWSTQHLETKPEDMLNVVASLIESGDTSLEEVGEATKDLKHTIHHGKGAIIIAQGIMKSPNPRELLANLIELAGEDGLVYPLFPHGNELGLMKAGLHVSFVPETKMKTIQKEERLSKTGRTKTANAAMNLSEMREAARNGEIDTVYVVDGSVSIDGFEDTPNIIYQSPFPSEWIEYAKVILPTAAFPEESGTFVNMEMRELTLNRVISPMGDSKEDWKIFSEIGKRLRSDGFPFARSEDIWEEIEEFHPTLHKTETNKKLRVPTATRRTEWYPCYRGVVLPDRIEGLGRLIESREEDVHPADSDVTLQEMIEQISEKINVKPGEK